MKTTYVRIYVSYVQYSHVLQINVWDETRATISTADDATDMYTAVYQVTCRLLNMYIYSKVHTQHQ